MEEPRELTVEDLEAEEIGELPDREAMSVVRPPAAPADEPEPTTAPT